MAKKTANFPNFITAYYEPSCNSSRAFQGFIRGLGEAKSKHVSWAILSVFRASVSANYFDEVLGTPAGKV